MDEPGLVIATILLIAFGILKNSASKEEDILKKKFNDLDLSSLTLSQALVGRILLYIYDLGALCISIKCQDNYLKDKKVDKCYGYLIGSAHLYRILRLFNFKEKEIEKVIFDLHKLVFSGANEQIEQEAFEKFLSNTKQFFQYYYDEKSLLKDPNLTTFILMDMFKIDLNEENSQLINEKTKKDFRIEHDKIFSNLKI